MTDGGERARILVLNQYYWPGVEATAHLLTELCEALAEDYEVEVVTGVLHGHEDEPRQIEHNGVVITMEDRLPLAEAVAIRNGRILAVGTNGRVLALKKRTTPRTMKPTAIT